MSAEPTILQSRDEVKRTGSEWCEYRRCGGKGLREVSERAVRRARVLLTIGRASWRVCESCADLLERERQNWSREPEKVRRVGLPLPSSEAAKRPEREQTSTRENPPKAATRKPRPPVRTKGVLAQEERREAKASKRRTAKLQRTGTKDPAAGGTFGAQGKRGAAEAEKRKRRAAWLERGGRS